MNSEMNYLERTGWSRYIGELWRGRELLGFLVWKEVKVQFAQTALGLAWLVVRPIMNVVVMTFIFGRLAKLPSDGQPYLLFALAGMLPWSYFSAVTSKSSMSLLGNTALITKIYFPRAYLPLSMVLAGLIEFAVTLMLFVVLSGLGYGVWPAINLPVLLLAFTLLMLFTVAMALWLAALAVDFRDVRHATAYILQILMFAAPVVWPVSLLGERLGANVVAIYGLYPMAGIVETFRAALFYTPDGVPVELLLPGTLVSLALLVSAIVYFRWRERGFADVV
jgi:lipopolysaccharide transport system permease protein